MSANTLSTRTYQMKEGSQVQQNKPITTYTLRICELFSYFHKSILNLHKGGHFSFSRLVYLLFPDLTHCFMSAILHQTTTGLREATNFHLWPPPSSQLNTTGPQMHLCYCKTLWIAVWLSLLPLKPQWVPQLARDWIPPGLNSWLILAGLLLSEWRIKYARHGYHGCVAL